MRFVSGRTMYFRSADRQPLPRPREDISYLLYLHIPFCESLCPYCSFHRIPFEPSLAKSYFRSVQEELRIYRDLGYRFDALYVGG